jgi:hypothetical protein
MASFVQPYAGTCSSDCCSNFNLSASIVDDDDDDGEPGDSEGFVVVVAAAAVVAFEEKNEDGLVVVAATVGIHKGLFTIRANPKSPRLLRHVIGRSPRVPPIVVDW